jgi:hypothetical protein
LGAGVQGPAQAQLAATSPVAASPASPPTAETVDNLATQTAAKAADGASQFQITLTPEGLGQVSVAVQVGAEGRVSAAFAFEKSDTADALSSRSADLQKALEQAGFSVAPDGLSFSVAPRAAHEATPTGGQASGQFAQTSGQGSGGSGAGGQNSNNQGNPGSNGGAGVQAGLGAGSGQGLNQGSGQNARQDGGWTAGQAAGRAFAAAAQAAALTDLPVSTPYAARAYAGLDIRI